MTILALDIGGTKVAAGLVDLTDPPRVQQRRSQPTRPERGGEQLLADLVQLAQEMIAAAPPGSVSAIGIGSAGVIDPETGCVTSATDLIPGWAGTPLGPALAAATGLPVAVTGDVLAHALGEQVYGAGRTYPSALAAGIGTGVGGALVANGQVRHGEHGVAGHLGHVGHRLARDLVCSCGRRGHMETIASGTGIADEYRRRTGRQLDGRAVDEAAEAGDEVARAVVTDAGLALGEVLAGLTNTWDPGVVIISGSVAKSGRTWWDAVRSGFAAQAMDPVAHTPLVPGQLGGDAPLLGAAHFAQTKSEEN